ncbi:GerAB/ArcD/ProY family transporter [Halanaerobaculum tunisiense]
MKKKITANQVFYICLAIVLPTLILTAAAGLAEDGKQLGWVLVMVAGGLGGILQYFTLKLSFNFSNQTIVQDCKKLLGPILGKLVVVPYMIIILYDAGFILFEEAYYIKFVMPSISYGFIYLILSGLAVYLVYVGIESLARVVHLGMIAVLAMIMISFLLILLNPGVLDFKRLQPVEFDLLTIVRGSIFPSNWFLLVPNLLLMLKPYFKDKSKVIYYSLGSNLVIQLITIMLYILSVSLLGVDLVANLTFPFYDIIKFGIRGLEIIVFSTWVVGAALKLGIFYFVGHKVVVEWFELRNDKSIIIPIAVFIGSFSLFQYKDVYLEAIIRNIVFAEIIYFYLPLPILFMIIYLFLGNKAGRN